MPTYQIYINYYTKLVLKLSTILKCTNNPYPSHLQGIPSGIDIFQVLYVQYNSKSIRILYM